RAQRERNRRSARLPAGHREISSFARTGPTPDDARRGGDVVIDLEVALADLADHLDHPAGAGSAEALRRRLTAPAPGIDRRRPVRALLVAAAVLAVVATGVVAIAPARHAVADWLGIGAVEVRRSDRPPVAAPSTTSHRVDP